MKKLTSMLGLLAVAAGLTAAVAMAPAPEKTTVKASFTDLHWFDLNGDPLTGTQEEIQAECGTPVVDCARGYEEVDQEGNPVGSPSETIQGELN